MKITSLNKIKLLQQKIKNNLLPKIKSDTFESNKTIKKFLLQRCGLAHIFSKTIEVEQNILDRAILYKKVFDIETKTIKKIPFEVGIAKSENYWTTTYHLIEDCTNKEIGYVTICDWKKAKQYGITKINKDTTLTDNYPRFGIKGDRISINYVKNNFQSEYSGVAAVADQLAIEYCLRNNIKPCIVSLSEINSHIAHYKRGRRFFIVKNGSGLNNFIAKFGTDDPNKIIERRMKEANTSKHIDCSDLGELYMYMPESVIQQYLIKIREHPLLH